VNLWGDYYWPRGLTVVSVAFLLPELYALFTNPANTLSDYAWRELHINASWGNGAHSIAWWCSLAAWLLFAVVITAHIWFKALR
jgi:hypothetical protein